MTSFLVLAVLGKPSWSLWQEWAAAEHKQREQNLASNREPPLQARVGVKGSEAEPGSDSNTDNDQCRLHDQKRSSVVRWQGLGLQDWHGDS